MAPSQTQCAAPVASLLRQSQPLSNSIPVMDWPPELDMIFEKNLAKYADEVGQKRWQKVASALPNKTPDDVFRRYELLVEDVDKIENGILPLPDYLDDDLGLQVDVSMNGLHRSMGLMMATPCGGPMNGMRMDGVSIGMPMAEVDLVGGDGVMMGGDGALAGGANRGACRNNKGKMPGHAPPKSSSEQERKKGIPWSEEEHRLFLLGLQKFGKGDWRSISRNYVISRTPTQVASHAQKYFIRLNSMNKDKRRASIHDITSLGNAVDMSGAVGGGGGGPGGPLHQGTPAPITGTHAGLAGTRPAPPQQGMQPALPGQAKPMVAGNGVSSAHGMYHNGLMQPGGQQPPQAMHGRPMGAQGAMGHMAAGHHPGAMQGIQQPNANGQSMGIPASVPQGGAMSGMAVGYMPQSQPQMMVQWKAPQ